ncbi:MAG: hypothetical protein NDJ94_09390 [Vicinamibacteria bacterium]|jgi:hypothetical protein|nr:hypothetical protein [Vicinamibacteria bacterium]
MLALVAALAAITAYWSSRPPEVAAPAAPAARPAPARVEPTPSTAPPRGGRDPFAFGGAAVDPAPEQQIEDHEPQFESVPQLPTPTPPPLRLAGLVGRDGRLHAALVESGEVVLAAVGESAFGWTVAEIDPVTGVLLRGADGAELRLPVAR